MAAVGVARARVNISARVFAVLRALEGGRRLYGRKYRARLRVDVVAGARRGGLDFHWAMKSYKGTTPVGRESLLSNSSMRCAAIELSRVSPQLSHTSAGTLSKTIIRSLCRVVCTMYCCSYVPRTSFDGAVHNHFPRPIPARRARLFGHSMHLPVKVSRTALMPHIGRVPIHSTVCCLALRLAQSTTTQSHSPPSPNGSRYRRRQVPLLWLGASRAACCALW